MTPAGLRMFLENPTGQWVGLTSICKCAAVSNQGGDQQATLSTLFAVEPGLSNELQLRCATHSTAASLWLHRVSSPASYGSVIFLLCCTSSPEAWRKGVCIGLSLMICEHGFDQHFPNQLFPHSLSFPLTQPPQNSFNSVQHFLAGMGVKGCQDTSQVSAFFPTVQTFNLSCLFH